jgi:hypothetical protein
MLNLNDYTSEQRSAIRTRLNTLCESLGGLGRVLSLSETIRESDKPVLQNKTASFHFEHGKVSWDKVLFADKVETLAGIIKRHDTFENLLETGSKKEQNTVRTLFPVTITVTPNDAEPFSFKIIDAPDNQTARINPLFELLFYASTGMIKKAIKED